MAFFSLFLIWIFIFLFTSGVAGIACGIIGLVITANKRRAGTPLPRVLNVVFPVVLSIGITLAMIPVSLFSLIFIDSIVSGVEDESFVQTDITIDEIGYQDKKFTANGVKYSVLDFTLTYEDEVEEEPIFTYKEDGLFGDAMGGNYYSVKNEQDFDLVSDGSGTLFCPDSQREEVIEFYTDISNINIYYNDWDGRYYRLKDKEKKKVGKLLDVDFDEISVKKIVLADAEEFGLEFNSADKLLYVKDCQFLIFNGTLYYVDSWEWTDDDDAHEYTLKKVPDDIADAILKIRNQND